MAMVTPTTANVLKREGPRIGAPSVVLIDGPVRARRPPRPGVKREPRLEILAAAACSHQADPSRQRYGAVTLLVAVRVPRACPGSRTACSCNCAATRVSVVSAQRQDGDRRRLLLGRKPMP